MSEPIYYEWKDEYSLGIESIDEEHKAMFLMIKVLHRYMEEEASQSTVNVFLTRVLKVAEDHFKTEEQFMLDNGTAKDFLERHTTEHQKLLRQIDDLKGKWNVTLTDEVVQIFANFLKGHILDYDKKIVEFSNS